MRILIVDDNVLIRDALDLVLRDAGHETRFAADGAAALALARQEEFDAVVLDYYLPDIMGDALAVKLREHCRGAAILLASGRLPQDLDLGGADLLFEKPFTPSSLLAAIARVRASDGGAL